MKKSMLTFKQLYPSQATLGKKLLPLLSEEMPQENDEHENCGQSHKMLFKIIYLEILTNLPHKFYQL